MKIFNRSLILRFSAIVLTLFVFNSFAYASAVSGKAPNFTLKSNSGKNIKLSELRGQVVLLNFWASWCGPCRKEMPLLNKLHKKYKKLGFTVLGVNVEENTRQAKKLLREVRVNFPVLFDTRNKTSKLYRVSAMPSTVMIDRDGKMRYLHKGYKNGDIEVYRKWVKKLVRE